MVLVSSSVIDEFFLVSLQFSILGFTIHCVCTAPLLDKDRLMKSGALATKCPNMTVLAEGTLKAGVAGISFVITQSLGLAYLPFYHHRSYSLIFFTHSLSY